ncbi:hypothetical protein GCM10009636_08530 [Arthrobacter koreensis]|uniref:AAA family ATPase n=1 Tax=Arthrobacter koreensis TaxID=199136 RepID=UPI0012649BDF|nr:AAA family ATPase [Arthrobacter koreensis]
MIIIGPEDDWETVMIPRLTAAGADLDRIFKIEVQTTFDEYTRQRSLRFPLDMDSIREAQHETGAKLIILDPAPSLMHGDMNKVQDVREAYEPLMALAQQCEVAMVLINHFGKGAGSVSAKLSGSHAWRDLTRSYLAFASDPDTGERVFSQDKNNYAESKGSYKFLLESVDVETDDGDTTNVARVNFLGETDTNVSDLINREPGGEDEQDDRNAAQAFVSDFIRDREGWEAPAAEVLKAGKAAGFTDNEIKHARRRCRNPRIASVKSSFGSGWVWQMEPEGATQQLEGAEGAKVPHAESLGTLVAPSTEDATKMPTPVELASSAPSAPWEPTDAEIRRLGMLLPKTPAEVETAMKTTPERAAGLYSWFVQNRKRTA